MSSIGILFQSIGMNENPIEIKTSLFGNLVRILVQLIRT